MRVIPVLAVLACLAAAAYADAPPTQEVLDDALKAIALTRDDLRFRTDYADAPDSFRVSVVDSLLTNPLHTEHYVHGLADRMKKTRSLEGLVVAAAAQLDLDAALGERGLAPPESGTMEPKSPGPHALDVLLPAAREAAREIEAAFAGLSGGDRDLIARHAPVLLEEEEFDPDKPIDVRDREAEEEEQLGDELLRIAGHVDYASIARAGAIVARAVDLAIPLVEDPETMQLLRPEGGITPGAGLERAASGDVWDLIATDAGIVAIGGPGPTTYTEACAIIIDVGGDDTYEACAAGTHMLNPVSIVIDLDGDDTYSGGHHTLAAGFMGVGILVDLEGADRYTAGSFSIGSGLFGVGVLDDRDGNDTYSGDTCVQGAGAFGLGVHRDRSGNDSYQSALFSQGFGFVMGVGIIHDVGGNDIYSAGWKYTDEIRYFDHFLSLSQGFGFGRRPDASGGIGLMVDEKGNDVYLSDIFGQGSSYWFAVGGLVDYEGNDQYVSYQYAQGAATHITVAALVDVAGDDNYVSKGVSQGCGHDLAIGILHDYGGDDNYTCHDLSQAAGNANGIGVLFDDAGNDAYSVRGVGNTHGYGNWRRDYGSVGIFIDAGGTDSYTGRGAEGEWWTYSTYGIGVDIETAVDEEAGEGAEPE